MNLQDAVSSIYQIVDQHQVDNIPSPFFFIVGAGISHPPVKLARQIEEDCRKIAVEKYKNKTTPKSTAPSDTYAHWLIQAHQTAKGVQRYLRKMMQDLPISKANLRLAHLLLDGRVARAVFTPNFDDMLERSLQLFGASPLICDHPLTVERMDPNAADIQIIHVHGSYWFYDCCNDPAEIKDRSINEPMSQILDYFLHDHSPIVVGYSGWEGDILMNALKRRLKSKLGYPIYWFCYQKTALDMLPEWLAKSEYIRFVFPDEPMADPNPQTRVASAEGAPDKSRSMEMLGASGGSSQKVPALSSDDVFDALVAEFKLVPPKLTRSPLELYAEQLKRFLGRSDSEADAKDTYYGFQNAIARVERASIIDAAKKPEALQEVREAMSQAKYQEVVRIARELKWQSLTLEEGMELMRVLIDASSSLPDGSEEEVEGYARAAEIGDSLLDRHPGDRVLIGLVAKALSMQGRSISLSAKYEESLRVVDDVLTRFSKEDDSVVGESIARALVSKSFCYASIGKNEESLAACNAVLERFGDAQEFAFRDRVAMALRNKGFSLRGLGRTEDALATYDDLLGRFKDAPEPSLRKEVATAWRYKGFILGELNRREEEVAAYDQLLEWFKEAEEPSIREEMATALLSKGLALSVLRKREEAVTVCDELLARFGEAKEPSIRSQVAAGLCNKGLFLEELGRKADAVAAYNDLLTRFGDVQDAAFRESIVAAMFNRGFFLNQLGDREQAITAYDTVVERFGDAPEQTFREHVAMALRNKGLILAELGRAEEAVSAYDAVLARFGDAPEQSLRETVAGAFVNKGLSLVKLGRKDEAAAAYDAVVARFEDAQEPVLREHVARAKVLRDLIVPHESPAPTERALEQGP